MVFLLTPRLWTALALYNAAVFVLYGTDKLRARRGWRRVPEATLLWAAALLGGAGAVLGICLFRHKTRKARFSLGVPLLLAVQIAMAWALQS